MPRDDKGRFLPGESGNPKGRRPRSTEEEYFEITQGVCTPSEWKAVVKKQLEKAKRGYLASARWLGDYLMGPAIQRMQLDHSVSNDKLREWIVGVFGAEEETDVADVDTEEGDV